MNTDMLSSKLAKAQEWTRQLDRSLAVMELWPTVFDNGRASSKWIGAHPVKKLRLVQEPLHLHHKFYITDGADEVRIFTYAEVPEILGGGLKEVRGNDAHNEVMETITNEENDNG